MLAELLSLHREMIEQLKLERIATEGKVEFLTGLIEQHEKTAAMLRAKLETFHANGNGHASPRPPVRLRPLTRVSTRSAVLSYESA